MSTIVYPGTFDPLTNGHVDIVKRAASLFKEVVVAVAESVKKNTQFSFEDRFMICRETFSTFKNVQVDNFDGLLIDFLKKKNAKMILRGIRGSSDIDFEFQLCEMNRILLPECETVFLKASDTTSSISSTMVREIAAMGGNVSLFVPPAVVKRLK